MREWNGTNKCNYQNVRGRNSIFGCNAWPSESEAFAQTNYNVYVDLFPQIHIITQSNPPANSQGPQSTDLLTGMTCTRKYH